MYRRIAGIFLLLIGPVITVNAGVGESAVITLAFPYGSRSFGMGEVGTALADDGSALYFNPAGLGVRNSNWRRGSAAYSFEPLLPAFRLTELWHSAIAGYYQMPSGLGGLGCSMNYINMGRNSIVDAMGREINNVQSWEAVWTLGWGFSFEEFGDSTRYAGLSFKPFVSSLAPGFGEHGEGVAQSFAIDLGYLRVLKNGFRFGLNLANMGPDIYYIDQSERDPIPFTVNTAVAWKRRIIIDRIEFMRIAAELRMDKELVVNHYDGDPEPFYKAMFIDMFNESPKHELLDINYHSGFEFWIMNTGCYRQGILFDYIGERYELHFGLGCNLFNHIRGDFSWIYAPDSFMIGFLRNFDKEKEGATGARHYQWHLTITIDALAGWSEKDRKWWMVNRKRESW